MSKGFRYWVDVWSLRAMSWRLALAQLTPAGDERFAQMLERLKPHQLQRIAVDVFMQRDKSLGARFIRWGWCPQAKQVLGLAMHDYVMGEIERKKALM